MNRALILAYALGFASCAAIVAVLLWDAAPC